MRIDVRVPAVVVVGLLCGTSTVSVRQRNTVPSKGGSQPDRGLSNRLRTAVLSGNVGAVRTIVAEGGDVNALDGNGQTFLMGAAAQGYVEIIRVLLDNGAAVDARAQGAAATGATPLMFAVANERVEATRLLLARGANPNLNSADGMTPLVEAAAHRSLDIVRLLIDARANPSLAPSKIRITPLIAAVATMEAGTGASNRARGVNIELVKLLLDKGASVNTQSAAGTALTQAAATAGNAEILRVLLANRAVVPRNALAEGAAGTGDVEMISLLIGAGADVNARGAERQTPLMHAAGRLLLGPVELLLSRGADPNAKDTVGRTALDIAIVSGKTAGQFGEPVVKRLRSVTTVK